MHSVKVSVPHKQTGLESKQLDHHKQKDHDDHITWHQHVIDKDARARLKQQKPVVLWFTGLSGSGKSTLAGALEARLNDLGAHTYLLDGDNVRHGLCCDLGFSEHDRRENIRRVGEVAALMSDAGLIVLTAFISPHQVEREQVKARFAQGEFIEVFVDTPLAVCEARDPKGLYQKARRGEIAHFTGIDAPYEAPQNPQLTLQTEQHSIEGLLAQCIDFLTQKHIIS